MSSPLHPEFDDADSIFSASAADQLPEGVNVFDEEVVPDDVEKTVTDTGDLLVKVPVGDVDLFDHSAEQDLIRDHQRNLGTAPPDLPPTSPTPIRNEPMMVNSADPLREEMERRFSQSFGDLKVEVTSVDRDAFVRSAVHDEELVFDIELRGINTVVKVAIPPDEFTNSASAAVTKWGKSDFIDKDSDLQWLLAFQQIHAWYQIREIGGAPTEWSDFWADGLPPVRSIREAMANPDTFSPIMQLNAARWRLMLDAIRIAELKYKICLQNWDDRSFFDGADTD